MVLLFPFSHWEWLYWRILFKNWILPLHPRNTHRSLNSSCTRKLISWEPLLKHSAPPPTPNPYIFSCPEQPPGSFTCSPWPPWLLSWEHGPGPLHTSQSMVCTSGCNPSERERERDYLVLEQKFSALASSHDSLWSTCLVWSICLPRSGAGPRNLCILVVPLKTTGKNLLL